MDDGGTVLYSTYNGRFLYDMPCFLAFDFDCMGALVFPDYSQLIPVKMQGVEQRIRRGWRGGAWAVAVQCSAVLCSGIAPVVFLDSTGGDGRRDD
ncbi:hypothetical protein HCBG_03327 [Histoplasma capsulatum G186AR]|uniref:Uncharacterized protein n=1 Tax=Ajellomyces capsulatus (strain G186AR / H82 / ATCC MYA-2454 / RMSCC 2432) TaxID=447093 RepID=C0NJJ7_AJECG|nr:uncharacterized protein HCBG_03327 [Histoplasma capsulatum G186AR]EEH08038.1 hypothetical protein HCBG_03327 [Histoplasma capsulatum G186AR]